MLSEVSAVMLVKRHTDWVGRGSNEKTLLVGRSVRESGAIKEGSHDHVREVKRRLKKITEFDPVATSRWLLDEIQEDLVLMQEEKINRTHQASLREGDSIHIYQGGEIHLDGTYSQSYSVQRDEEYIIDDSVSVSLEDMIERYTSIASPSEMQRVRDLDITDYKAIKSLIND